MSSRKLVAGLTATAVVLFGGVASALATTIGGAGSSFAAPIWQTLASQYTKGHGNNISYQSIGSGAGKAQLIARTVDFAGSDNVMNGSEAAGAAQSGGPVQHLPIALGAITVSYNVPGVKGGLKLTGSVIANIYLGKIGAWDNPVIKKLNPGVKLPHLAIAVVHRSDSSGTSFGFTEFLSQVSGPWAGGPGTNQNPHWPAGIGAKGNDGVAATIKQTKGAIGYVEQAYALQNKFTYASVQNKAGQFVTPDLAATAAAGKGLKASANLKIDVLNSPQKGAYPITSQTFAIVYKDLCKGGTAPDQAKLTAQFIGYVLSPKGQATIQKLSYAPLPSGLLAKVQSAVHGLQCNGKPVL